MLPQSCHTAKAARSSRMCCGTKSFWIAVSVTAVSPWTHGKAKGWESASPAGSLIAKQQQTWTHRLTATPGTFRNTESRLLKGSREISSKQWQCPPWGRLFVRSAVKIKVYWMSHDLISQAMAKSLSRAGLRSTEFQFIRSSASGEA